MRSFVRWSLRVIGLLAVAIAFVWLLGPREAVVLKTRFDPTSLPPDLDAYLQTTEAMIGPVTPGAQKQIVWAGQKGAKTDLAIVYLHGFSATAAEIRPVPDRVAAALGANLFFTRFAGHGLPGDRLSGPSVQDWMDDVAEALAIGQRLGSRVILMATSTGGTMAAEAALSPELSDKIAGIVFVSPNFGLKNPASAILTMPAARWWGPVVAGRERCFTPVNDLHARFWTTCYPTTALFPMGAVAAHAGAQDYAQVKIPALFIYSPDDQVVSPDATERVFESWGGPKDAQPMKVGVGDDPYSHVIAGDILSPSMTQPIAEAMIGWINRLP